MLKKKPVLIAAIAIAVVTSLITVFQNCAKAGYVDPDVRHSAIAMGLCKECGDESGSGLSCRTSQASAFSVTCFKESCRTGFELQDGQCQPVICEAGTHAACPIEHGTGTMTCKDNRRGYNGCVATDCEEGYVLTAGHCVAAEVPPNPTKLCDAGSHRDCGDESQEAYETCAGDGMSYGACEKGDCKAGYYKNEAGACVVQECTPGDFHACSENFATGKQTCNSVGSNWGVCVLDGCIGGYEWISGVCTVKICTSGEKSDCDSVDGSGYGEKTCNDTGTDYGVCELTGCNSGYFFEDGQCKENVCTPNQKVACPILNGTGEKPCMSNGKGYGECTLKECNSGYKKHAGLCVSTDYCDDDNDVTCDGPHGSGHYNCKDDHKVGSCRMEVCEDGWELTGSGQSASCSQKKKNK